MKYLKKSSQGFAVCNVYIVGACELNYELRALEGDQAKSLMTINSIVPKHTSYLKRVTNDRYCFSKITRMPYNIHNIWNVVHLNVSVQQYC
ncbi:hypothetical protein H8356DRAFT_1337527 [Neocallimastix lanati (nom. inval.)]|nr:hypothetical protein H8356DRAFT_1337527 [Neocallimastix sp. JGI-2020a]